MTAMKQIAPCAQAVWELGLLVRERKNEANEANFWSAA